MKKSILFISTHTFATNPRLVKEVELALKNNYNVSVLCCSFTNWSKHINEEIKKKLLPQIHYYEIPGNRKPLLPWILSSTWFSFSKITLRLLPKNAFLLSLASNKRSWLLLRNLKRIIEKPDLIVAHNPGSFYSAKVYAKKHGVPFGIDLEDYHPGETNDANGGKIMKSLMRATIPDAAYVTTASESIQLESLKLVPFQGTLILNYFLGEEFKEPASKPGKLRLVWFSQNISFNRGLEEVIPVIEKLEDVELHLFGNCNDAFKIAHLQNLVNVFLHSPLPQKELHLQLSDWDAGLAIEPGKDRNNDLAVSNKILAYFQAGLFIIASQTTAQKLFLKNHPCHGIIVDLGSGLKKSIQKIIAEKEEIRAKKVKRFCAARKYNWETESEKLLIVWNQVLFP